MHLRKVAHMGLYPNCIHLIAPKLLNVLERSTLVHLLYLSIKRNVLPSKYFISKILINYQCMVASTHPLVVLVN